ncbi:alpha-tocopherol transfer protein-like [Schistocerca americana]|uniref:alpha-tocopherol transfer protein-like n=1 Tax=Schistocerca americana TaxID=7009 RepID=UPI001F4F58BA|nr:alpha-tocopherol transfer protein-like [Schistocerca americana]
MSVQGREDVRHIREWLEHQPHLPQITDEKIMLFLHSCHYSLERTKSTIDTYFSLKTTAPEFFSERNPENEELRRTAKIIQVSPFPQKTPEGYRIIFGRLLNTDPSQFDLASAIKYLFMVIDAVLKEDGLIPGFIIVYDMTGVSLGHLTRINIATVKKYFMYVQEAIPLRRRGIHVINVNSVITSIMSIIKPFMSQEHMQALHFHTSNNFEEFYKHVPQRLMPKDFNGEMTSCDSLHSETIKKLESYKDWFHEEESLKSDENKRDIRSVNLSNGYSTVGSFKKLNID